MPRLTLAPDREIVVPFCLNSSPRSLNVLRRHATALLCLATLVWPVNAQEPRPDPYDLPAEVEAKIDAALTANYRLQFDRAETILRTLEAERARHPLIGFGHLLNAWWELTAAVLEEDETASQPMLEAAEIVLAEAETRIDAGDPTGEAHLVKGATLGLIGRWHITNHHWWRSYIVGKRAKAALEEALVINPGLIDAYAGIGIFDYFVAKLPGIVRFVAFGGAENNPEVGRREIDLALAEGRFTVVGTQAALALIELRNELNPTRALALIDELLAGYPDSAFFRSLRTIALYDLNRPAELTAEAELQAQLLAEGRFPANRAAQVDFTRGLAHFRAREWTEAHADFLAAVKHADRTDPWGTWALLHLGYLLDLDGNRPAAREQYRQVKRLTNRMGTARLADRHLDVPFTASNEQMTRLLPD